MKYVNSYQMVSSSCRVGFEKLVASAIANGWQPHGSPFFAEGHYHQAMVGYE